MQGKIFPPSYEAGVMFQRETSFAIPVFWYDLVFSRLGNRSYKQGLLMVIKGNHGLSGM